MQAADRQDEQYREEWSEDIVGRQCNEVFPKTSSHLSNTEFYIHWRIRARETRKNGCVATLADSGW